MKEFEKKFNWTLKSSSRVIEGTNTIDYTNAPQSTMFGGEDMFYLFETYGFPSEMTIELLKEKTAET